jgi:hypothetical protein
MIEWRTDIIFKNDIFSLKIWVLVLVICISFLLTACIYLFMRIESLEDKIEIQNKKINVLIDKFEVQ